MNSIWAEIGAVVRKEALTEMRARNGIATSALFALVTVVAIALATFNRTIDKDMASGLLWVAILFAAVITLPRVMVTEEEQGTADLLRMLARPEAVYWGKCIFNGCQIMAASFILSFLFFGFTHVGLESPGLFALSVFGGSMGLAGSATMCGALVARAANRAMLAGAIAVPLLLPLVALGVSGMRVAIGPIEADFVYDAGVRAVIGLDCYGIATLAIGVLIFPFAWKS